MREHIIETLAAEANNLDLHVSLCAQRYQQLITKFDEVELRLDGIESCLQDIRNKLNVEQTSKLKTYLTWAGVIIATLSSCVIALLVKSA